MLYNMLFYIGHIYFLKFYRRCLHDYLKLEHRVRYTCTDQQNVHVNVFIGFYVINPSSSYYMYHRHWLRQHTLQWYQHRRRNISSMVSVWLQIFSAVHGGVRFELKISCILWTLLLFCLLVGNSETEVFCIYVLRKCSHCDQTILFYNKVWLEKC